MDSSSVDPHGPSSDGRGHIGRPAIRARPIGLVGRLVLSADPPPAGFPTLGPCSETRLRSLWAEPRAPDPPRRVWRDWALVAALVPVAVLEVRARATTWSGRSPRVVVVVALVPTLLWRRTHPLAAVVVAFGTLAVVDVVSLAVDVDWEGLNTNVFVLLLLYALFRWGSGREAALGLAVVLDPASGASATRPTRSRESRRQRARWAVLVLLVVAALGASVRYQDKAPPAGWTRSSCSSASSWPASSTTRSPTTSPPSPSGPRPAGSSPASDPAAALDALAVIEEEASRTLAEMRAMVGALRQGEEPDLAPQRGVADIERLATGAGERPHVDVELSGDLDGLRPSVDAALYRLAQESITNARRHARHATRIEVTRARRRRLRAAHGRRRRRRRRVRSALVVGVRADRHGRAGQAARRHPRGRTRARNRGWTVQAVLPRGRGGS